MQANLKAFLLFLLFSLFVLNLLLLGWRVYAGPQQPNLCWAAPRAGTWELSLTWWCHKYAKETNARQGLRKILKLLSFAWAGPDLVWHRLCLWLAQKFQTWSLSVCGCCQTAMGAFLEVDQDLQFSLPHHASHGEMHVTIQYLESGEQLCNLSRCRCLISVENAGARSSSVLLAHSHCAVTVKLSWCKEMLSSCFFATCSCAWDATGRILPLSHDFV